MLRRCAALFGELRGDWKKRGHDVGFGVGIASGYATLGIVGVEGRFDYSAIGNVVNIASRLCDRAADGEILISQRALADIEGQAMTEPAGALELKGVEKPVEAHNVVAIGTEDRLIASPSQARAK